MDDPRIETLFKKLDDLSAKFIQHDKEATANDVKYNTELDHIKKEIEDIFDESKIQKKDSTVKSELLTESMNRMKDDLKKDIETAKKETLLACNNYTNIIVSSITVALGLIGALLAALDHIFKIGKP